MSKLCTRTFHYGKASSDSYRVSSDISVDSEGVFHATVPPEIATAAMTLEARTFWITKPRDKSRISARDLATIEAVITQAMEEYISSITTVERVIVYSHRIDTAAWEATDGSLHANGGIPNEPSGGRWHPMANSNTSHLQIGLYARVFDMVTHHHPNSTKLEFRRPKWGHGPHEHPTWGSKLNGFPTLEKPNQLEALPRLPYTEENAQFFYDMMIRLCQLGRNLHEFLSSEDNIVNPIQQQTGSGLLPQSPPPKSE